MNKWLSQKLNMHSNEIIKLCERIFFFSEWHLRRGGVKQSTNVCYCTKCLRCVNKIKPFRPYGCTLLRTMWRQKFQANDFLLKLQPYSKRTKCEFNYHHRHGDDDGECSMCLVTKYYDHKMLFILLSVYARETLGFRLCQIKGGCVCFNYVTGTGTTAATVCLLFYAKLSLGEHGEAYCYVYIRLNASFFSVSLFSN